jgi:hypothetical protein
MMNSSGLSCDDDDEYLDIVKKLNVVLSLGFIGTSLAQLFVIILIADSKISMVILLGGGHLVKVHHCK